MKPTDGTPDSGADSTQVEAVIAPNPGPLTLDGTRTWVVGTGSVALIDPGPESTEHLARLQTVVDGRTVDAILLTHAHSDHAGGASAAAAIFGAPVMAASDTLARTGLAGRVLREGDTISIGGSVGEGSDVDRISLQVVETPGHAADHVSFLLLPDRWLFTGDLVLGEGSSAVLHPDGRMSEYLASIRKLEALGPARLLPGHGPPVEKAGARLSEYRRHRLDRDRQIQLAIESGSGTVSEIREAVYGPLDPGLHAAAEASVSAHLVHLRERGMDAPEPGPGMFETLGLVSGRDGLPGGEDS